VELGFYGQNWYDDLVQLACESMAFWNESPLPTKHKNSVDELVLFKVAGIRKVAVRRRIKCGPCGFASPNGLAKSWPQAFKVILLFRISISALITPVPQVLWI
jgi:hypothetical protein